MRKYKQLKHAVQLQKQLDHKYGARRFHAAFIMALFFCLFFTSCSNSPGDSSSSSSSTTRAGNSTHSSQSTNGNTTLTITRTGQTAGINETAPPNDHLHRIYNVYFAKKKVVGTEVFFEPIDSAHPQRDGQNNLITYDSILGKTVYLVLETRNLTPNEQIRVEIQSESLTGNTNALEVMYFNASRQYTSAQTLTAVVGNFDALNNNTGACPYTNLADHSHRAIIKLQLRPSTRAIFDEWATRLGTTNGTVQVRVQRNRGNCAYGNSNRETSEGGTFLSSENQQFRVVNRNFFDIYHGSNSFNFNSNTTFIKDGTRVTMRRRISRVENNTSDKVVYYYYDLNDNEHILCQRDIVTVTNKRRVATIPALHLRGRLLKTISYAENRRLGEDIDAIRSEIYENGTLSIHNSPTGRDRWYGNQPGSSKLVSMEFLNTPLPTRRVNNYIFEEFNYDNRGTRIRYGFMNTRRRHIRMDIFAGFLGALAQFSQEGHAHLIVSQGFSFEDNSCFPSAEHVNGNAGDLNYLSINENGERTLLSDASFDYDNQVIFCKILIDYGFQSFRSEYFSNRVNTSSNDNTNTLLPNSVHTTNPRHNHHLHIYNFRRISNIYE
ncbi:MULTISPECIES: hypothetical protein [unclassified Gilliamella]|uniref:hypothetical protein n=1 Tax=unclassified Gilliamella TaxID=2685620 RepID=UPI0013077865|nr:MULTISPECIES: hypothetical protein [unclassified Gilliamella]MWP50367.1 hypothetical protein [Gilliamella sp. Lep-s35]MWP70089.1 hypothetical protein [Gilliamella sp. Lep-s5]MWP78319.1 hypothetical protein [Gilliamella sp. Lep-s21]